MVFVVPEGTTKYLIKPVENEGFWVPVFRIRGPGPAAAFVIPVFAGAGPRTHAGRARNLAVNWELTCNNRVHELKLAKSEQRI